MKKIAAIHDLSGIGRCSLTVALPIISALKLQCCPFPTAILSSQTGYPEYTFLDFTSEMTNYHKVWSNLGINFDCIYTGFLGSNQQVDIVSSFINKNSNAFIVVDPVMGDNGSIYPVFDTDTCIKIKELVKHSNLTTPNLTEACFLTGRDYNDGKFNEDDLINIAKSITKLGPSQVIITGILDNNHIINLGYDSNINKHFFIKVKYNNRSYSGTGDIFTSVVSSLLTRGYDLEFSSTYATNYIYKCINYTSTFNTDRNDGVMFEQFLSDLTSL